MTDVQIADEEPVSSRVECVRPAITHVRRIGQQFQLKRQYRWHPLTPAHI